MTFLSIRGVEKSFGAVKVLRDVDLDVERGELLALLGPSGSGKSTLLRIVAGFETAERGSLLLEGSDFTATAPQRRGFGMVFQSYALFPHLNVFDNVAFGLSADPARRLGKDATRERVMEMLELVQLEALADRGIDQISGGQQQRVALARALAPSPKLLLLDEPLSNLDPSLRDQTRQQLRSVLRSVGITAILVTHEQEEAFELGDRVAVLDAGRIEQVATPLNLYRDPTSAFVARFIGRANALAARPVGSNNDLFEIDGWDGQIELSDDQVITSRDSAVVDGVETDLVWIRPEHCVIEADHASGGVGPESATLPSCTGRVRSSRLLGPYSLVEVELNAPAQGSVEVASRMPVNVGAEVRVAVAEPGAVRLLRTRG